MYLTSPNPELDALVRATPRGMAHWSGHGPSRDSVRQLPALWIPT